MITLLDDYAVHQTPEPLSRPATSDRNFYDRWFFSGVAADGRCMFEAALGLYPHRRVMDAHFTVLADGGMNDVEIIRWLHTPDPTLPVGDTPLDALRLGHKTEVRRRAQALAF